MPKAECKNIKTRHSFNKFSLDFRKFARLIFHEIFLPKISMYASFFAAMALDIYCFLIPSYSESLSLQLDQFVAY